jgi:hypothetical protein
MSETQKLKYIDLKEFRDAGYLQEANRRFFHPLGLALVIMRADDGTVRLAGVSDARDEAEGIYFAEDPGDGLKAKADNIDAEWRKREPARVAALGFMVQPAEDR